MMNSAFDTRYEYEYEYEYECECERERECARQIAQTSLRDRIFDRAGLHVAVVDVHSVLEKTRSDGSVIRIAEALVADSTGAILLTLRNEQIAAVSVGASLTLRNVRVEMFKSHMRIAVDKWGVLETSAQPLTDKLDTANNLSAVEYELVNVE